MLDSYTTFLIIMQLPNTDLQSQVASPLSILLRSSLIISLEDVLDIALERDMTTQLRQYKLPRTLISSTLGQKLQSLDPEETLYHIEFNVSEFVATAKTSNARCILWEISDWKTSYKLYQRKKEESAKRVEAWDRRKLSLIHISEPTRQ